MSKNKTVYIADLSKTDMEFHRGTNCDTFVIKNWEKLNALDLEYFLKCVAKLSVECSNKGKVVLKQRRIK
jgi:hypothetical protein